MNAGSISYVTPARISVAELVKGLQLDQIDAERAHTPHQTSANDDGSIPEGGRNNALTSLAGSLRSSGASEADILIRLLAHNAAVCVPPLPHDEVAGIAKSIAKYPTNPFDLNDTGNANRLVRNYGHDIRYVPQWNRWIKWNGTRWERDESGLMVELGKSTARMIFKEAPHTASTAMIKAISAHANSSLQAGRLKAMIELAQSCPGIPIKISELDSHPMLLAVANGILELSVGALRPAAPEDLITRVSPVAYEPTATCPTFDTFIKKATGGDSTLSDYLQRLAGYCLSGDTREQAMFFLYGSGANGKSTFLTVLRELLGDELARQCPAQTLMTKRPGGASNDIARLVGARVVMATEIEDGAHFDEPLVKQLTGGERIAARFLYSEHFEFLPEFKLLIGGNHKPVIKGDDDGIWRRIHLIPFTTTVPPGQRDPLLMEKLRAELPGILNWALAGFQQWQAQGLSPPKAVTDAVKDYRAEMDIMLDWINDACVLDPAFQQSSKDLYMSYKFWCISEGYKPFSHKAFARKFDTRYSKHRTQNGYVYSGIKLK